MKIKIIILFMVMCICLTGCASSDFNLNIEPNGDVIVEHLILINENEFNDYKEIFNIDEDNFVYNGFSIEKVKYEEEVGYRIYKNLGNIDYLSRRKKRMIELSSYSSEDFPVKMMFERRGRFLYNTYVGHFSVDLTDMDELTAGLPFNKLASNIQELDSNKVSNMSTMSEDMLYLLEDIDAKFTLNTSGIVRSANTKINKNGKYIWELEFGKVNEIYFKVDRINKNVFFPFMIILSIGILVFAFIQLVKRRKYIYDSVSLRDSLRLDYKDEVKDIYEDYKNKKNNEFDRDNINYKIGGGSTNLKGFQNQKDIDKLKEKYEKIGKKKEIVSINDEVNPNFRLVDDQVKEELNKEVNKELRKKNKKFVKDDN